jgi:hypothetical protein
MVIAGYVMLGLLADFALAVGAGRFLARRTPPEPEPVGLAASR